MCLPPQKNRRNIFGQLSCEIRAFSGQISSKFGHLDNFSGKYHVKLGHFVNFSHTIFGQKCPALKVDWAPTPMVDTHIHVYSLSMALLSFIGATAPVRSITQVVSFWHVTENCYIQELDGEIIWLYVALPMAKVTFFLQLWPRNASCSFCYWKVLEKQNLPCTAVAVFIRQPHELITHEAFSTASQRLLISAASVLDVTLVNVCMHQWLTAQQHTLHVCPMSISLGQWKILQHVLLKQFQSVYNFSGIFLQSKSGSLSQQT